MYILADETQCTDKIPRCFPVCSRCAAELSIVPNGRTGDSWFCPGCKKVVTGDDCYRLVVPPTRVVCHVGSEDNDVISLMLDLKRVYLEAEARWQKPEIWRFNPQLMPLVVEGINLLTEGEPLGVGEALDHARHSILELFALPVEPTSGPSHLLASYPLIVPPATRYELVYAAAPVLPPLPLTRPITYRRAARQKTPRT